MVAEFLNIILLSAFGVGLLLAITGVVTFKNPYISILGIIAIIAATIISYRLFQPELVPITGIVAWTLMLAIGIGIAIALLGIARFRNPYISMLGLIILAGAIIVTYRLAIPS